MSDISDLIIQCSKLEGRELPSYQVQLLEQELVERLGLTSDDVRAACRAIAYSGKDVSLRNILFSIPGAWPEPREALGMLWHAPRMPSLVVQAIKPFDLQDDKLIREYFLIAYERLVVNAWMNGKVRAEWISKDEFFEAMRRQAGGAT
jgi:hypothetical protein